MIDFYTTDNYGVFVSKISINPYQNLPSGTLTPPPTVTGIDVAVWADTTWVMLPEHPKNSTTVLDELRQKKWEQIKAERERRSQHGGYQAAGKWFHSDTFSRSQQLGLVLLGANVPPGLMWKTMDGTFIEMTPALAQQVFQAAALSDNAFFSYAENLRQQIENSEDPESIDIATGWPPTFEEATSGEVSTVQG